MVSHKADVLPLLTKSKEFILDLEGSKLPLKKLCIGQLEVLEKEFDHIIKINDDGKCIESDADSNGDLR